MGFNLFINFSSVFMECCFEKDFKIVSGFIKSFNKEVIFVMSVRRERRESDSSYKLSICRF